MFINVKIHHIWSMETPNEQLGQGTATVFNGLIKMCQVGRQRQHL